MKRKNSNKNDSSTDSLSILKNKIETRNNFKLNINSKSFFKKRRIKIKKMIFNNENDKDNINKINQKYIMKKGNIILDKKKMNSTDIEDLGKHKSISCPNLFNKNKIKNNKIKKLNKPLSSSTLFSNNNEKILKRMNEILLNNQEPEDKNKYKKINIFKFNNANKLPLNYNYKNLPENNPKTSLIEKILGNLETNKFIKNKHNNYLNNSEYKFFNSKNYNSFK